MPLKMPEKTENCGGVRVTQSREGYFEIGTTTDGVEQEIELTHYNAWRIFGMLATALQIPLPKRVSTAITEGSHAPIEYTIRPGRPLESLGDKLAWHIQNQLLAEELAKSNILLVKATEVGEAAAAPKSPKGPKGDADCG